MKIEILHSQPKAGGGQYEAGQTYDFPDDVALRWIAAGRAREARKTNKKTAEGSTE